jgi:hypothetical protein
MQTSGSATKALASPRSPDVHSRFDEVEKYLREQRMHEAATARQPVSFKDAIARAQPSSVQGIEPYIPLHQARIPARSDTHPARALDGSGLRLPASVGSGDVVAKLDKLTAELQQLQQQRVQRTQVTTSAVPARPRLEPAADAPVFYSRADVAPKEAPAKAVDMDFVALQRVFEEMLSKEEPPNYDDFLKRTSFLPRAPSPPRAALHAVGATAGSPPMVTSPQLPSRIRPPRL